MVLLALLGLLGCEYTDDEPVEDGMYRNRRGARAEPPETDPRFARAAAQLGRVAPVQTNWGKRTHLLGSDPGQTSMLLYLEGDASYPWQVSVSSLYTGAFATTPLMGAVVTGTFGTGGATCRVEFDAKPDQTLQLPGGVINLQVAWDPIYTGNAANNGLLVQPAVNQTFLPSRADIQGVACMGETGRGQAFRTRTFRNSSGAGTWLVDLPPFADTFMVSLGLDASYANITTLEFVTSTDPAVAQPLVEYTGAQLLALKNAGVQAPVPGTAVAARLTLAANVIMYLGFTLSL